MEGVQTSKPLSAPPMVLFTALAMYAAPARLAALLFGHQLAPSTLLTPHRAIQSRGVSQDLRFFGISILGQCSQDFNTIVLCLVESSPPQPVVLPQSLFTLLVSIGLTSRRGGPGDTHGESFAQGVATTFLKVVFLDSASAPSKALRPVVSHATSLVYSASASGSLADPLPIHNYPILHQLFPVTVYYWNFLNIAPDL